MRLAVLPLPREKVDDGRDPPGWNMSRVGKAGHERGGRADREHLLVGDRGELGDGVTTQYTFPQPVVGLTGASAIAAGDDDTCALVGGSVWCWGDNRVGQVGDGLLGNSATLDGGVLTPVRVKW